jgi:DNA-binding response OmpR family regulator
MNKAILVVDDEAAIRDLFARVLTSAGYQVQAVESGEEALKLMDRTPHWVMFLDANLPGMNGMDLCRQIRSRWPMAIAFAVTGYASLFQLVDCLEAGFEDYFTKPANLKELLAAAERAFAKLERWENG